MRWSLPGLHCKGCTPTRRMNNGPKRRIKNGIEETEDSKAFIPLIMFAGRTVELLAGTALALGIFPRTGCVGTSCFHCFRNLYCAHLLAISRKAESQAQLVNFFKNVTTW